MGLRNDRLARLQAAIAAWRQKILDERAAAEATARAEREAAAEAAAQAAATKAASDTATYLSELNTLDTEIATLVTSVTTEETTIATALTAVGSASTSSAAATQRDIIIDASANITRYINDIGVKKAALEVAYSNIKKSTDDYDDLADELSTGTGYYNTAIANIDSVADSKKDAESAVSAAVTKVSQLIASEAAAAAEAARLAAVQQAEDDRLEAELTKATAAVTTYLSEVQTIAGDIDTTVASMDTASATIGTNKTAAGNATTSADAITARDAIAVQSANITVLSNTLGAKAAALESSYANLKAAAGSHSTLQDELATGTTEYNDAQDAIQSVSTAKKDAENNLIYAQNAASTLLASEAAAQAASDAAAAQAAAELEAQQQAAAAQAAAEATAQTYKTEAMAYTDTKVADLVDSAPGTLDTLNELAAALGDDPNFATTVSANIGTKVDKINITGKTVGSSTAIPVITYNNQGQITTATTTAITVGNGAMSVNAGSGLIGGGQVGTANQTGSSSVTISHADTSSVTNIDTSGKVVIDALTFDTYGHVTGATSRSLDFYTTGEADSRYVNVTGDNMTGNLQFHGTATTTTQNLGIVWTGFDKEGTTDPSDNAYIKHLTNTAGLTGSVLEISSMNDANDGINLKVNSTTSGARINGNPIFNDGYHPNADKWTTARTLTLTGDVTGSVSMDGSGNVSMTTTVGNDSHNHSSSSGNFTVNGDLLVDEIRARTNQDLTITAGESYTIMTDGSYNDEYIRLGAENGVVVYSSTDNLTSGLNKSNTLIDTAGDMLLGGNLYPKTDNTGQVGNGTYTWNFGQFTNLQVDSTLTVRGAIDLADNDRIRVGSGDDMQIWHDGSNTYFRNYLHADGDFIWQGEGTGGVNHTVMQLKNDTTAPYVILYADSVEKFRTIAGGVKITGSVSQTETHYPDVSWGASTTSTGAILISLPGTSSQYDMVNIEITVYEYNSTAGSTITVSGHNWTTGWANSHVEVQGGYNKPIYLGRDGSKYYIQLGDTNSSWTYGSVHVTRATTATYYNVIDWTTGWGISQATTEPSYSQKSSNFNTASSATLRTPGTLTAAHVDLSNTLKIGSEVVLQESTDRADLLEISSTTSGWGGLQIRNSSNEGRWSFMTDGEASGIYNDEDGIWHIYMLENTARGCTAIGGSTIDTNYSLSMNSGGIRMYNNSVDYVSQLHFNDNVRFVDEGNDQYLRYKWGDTGAGGIKFYDGNDTLHGTVYGNGAGQFGLLTSTGEWGVRIEGNGLVELRYDNSAKLQTTSTGVAVTGLLTATQKSFTIDHPTKEGMKLRYGSLEGPENGVYVRGRLKGSNVIELPEVWTGLVHEDTITVNLTAIGGKQDLWVEDIIDNTVIVGGEGDVNCFYTVFAERKDVDKLEVEFEE